MESPLFNKGVGAIHGTITDIQQHAYDTLLKVSNFRTPNLPRKTSTHSPPLSAQATEDHDKRFPPTNPTNSQSNPSDHSSSSPEPPPHRPRADETELKQNEQLRKLIEKTKRDIGNYKN